jgi:hypothetical protein
MLKFFTAAAGNGCAASDLGALEWCAELLRCVSNICEPLHFSAFLQLLIIVQPVQVGHDAQFQYNLESACMHFACAIGWHYWWWKWCRPGRG